MRIATGVKVPESSPLRHLSNCIVFSQQGTRELPSQLSGGDLNGDRFHILYDPRLALLKVEHAADYTPVTPHDLGRPVETKDRADFFINHMKIDNLGQISNKHKIRADKFERETKHSDCKDLARHASKAVDFSKSGVPVHPREIPRGEDHIRPDFMRMSYNFDVNDSGITELVNFEVDDPEEYDSLDIIDPPTNCHMYYPSKKVLGHLYRSINERTFFAPDEQRPRDAATSMWRRIYHAEA
ncbi:RdRP-domain-containing protein [Phaeosphaeriaceae sp. SRC1lsM3a]|nr:RdRP-domain-containing protein [Stagonospora sp. SRC1lsM3a]